MKSDSRCLISRKQLLRAFIMCERVCVLFICEAGLYYCLNILQVCGTHATRIETWDTRGIDGILREAASYLLTNNYDEIIMQLD